MKLDPLFQAKDNELYTIEGSKVELKFTEIKNIDSPCDIAPDSICNVIVDQKVIETEPELYNEEYLAKLRDYLKAFEDKKIFAVLTVNPLETSDNADSPAVESYTSCVKHATRRIKDCESLCGVCIPDSYAKEGDAVKVSFLIDELVKKHGHYVYFASKDVLEKAEAVGKEYSDKIVVF